MNVDHLEFIFDIILRDVVESTKRFLFFKTSGMTGDNEIFFEGEYEILGTLVSVSIFVCPPSSRRQAK